MTQDQILPMVNTVFEEQSELRIKSYSAHIC